jgi:hypothetical protein
VYSHVVAMLGEVRSDNRLTRVTKRNKKTEKAHNDNHNTNIR